MVGLPHPHFRDRPVQREQIDSSYCSVTLASHPLMMSECYTRSVAHFLGGWFWLSGLFPDKGCNVETHIAYKSQVPSQLLDLRLCFTVATTSNE